MTLDSGPAISVVIPVFNDADALARTLDACDWGDVEVIVSATSADRQTLVPIRENHPTFFWIEAPRGRARQMNAGAAAARGQWLLFLHADTRLPPGWRTAIDDANRTPQISIGCFRFALDSTSPFARAIELGVRLRLAIFALPYGDQALFVRRKDFHAAGGYADLPIMEDVDLVRRFKQRGELYCSPHPALTSARKWERDGWVRRTLVHIRLILLYFLGVTPGRLSASI